MRKYTSLVLGSAELMLAGLITFILIRSALDIYNNFAYDKAIIKDSPYGFTPLLSDPKNYSSFDREMFSGEYVYVVDWLSAYNGKVVFAKVKSRLMEGYINKDLLVSAHINVRPIVSIFLLLIIFTFYVYRTYHKFAV